MDGPIENSDEEWEKGGYGWRESWTEIDKKRAMMRRG